MRDLLFYFLITALLFATAGLAHAENIPEVTDATFRKNVEEASREQPILVFFQAPWCGPCRTMLPGLVEFARDEKFKLVSVDVDKNPATSQKFGVASLPFTMAFRNGNVTSTLLGAGEKEKLRGLLKVK